MVAAREKLKVKKQRFDGAMATIQRLAPDVVAVSRRVQADQQDAAMHAQVAARRAKRNAGLGAPGGNGSAASASGGGAAAGPGSPGGAGTDPDLPIMTFEFTGWAPRARPRSSKTRTRRSASAPPPPVKAIQKPFTRAHHVFLVPRVVSLSRHPGRVLCSLAHSFPGMAAGVEEAVVSRKRGEVVVKAGADVFLCLDLGRSRAMVPTHYTLCHGSPAAGNDLLSFTLEGHSKAVSQCLAAPGQKQRTLKSRGRAGRAVPVPPRPVHGQQPKGRQLATHVRL